MAFKKFLRPGKAKLGIEAENIKVFLEDGTEIDEDVQLETLIPELAKATLLTTDEVKMWFAHLQLVKDRRKEGAKKAKDTRTKKKGICTKSLLQ